MFSIFKIFFALGWVSFGGPAAHIGYFRHSFVEKRAWLTDKEYADFVALSQFLPGPGSSQVGFAIGYHRGGLPGAICAFLGFTLPSMFLMLLLAAVSHHFINTPIFEQLVHGLKLLAVVVVADAALGMYRNFCRSKITITLCAASAVALLVAPSMTMQITVLIFSALIGTTLLNTPEHKAIRFKPNYFALSVFGLLLIIPALFFQSSPINQIFNAFFQTGSLVFGGGHVVLPLLQHSLGEQISEELFITGYSAAQAVPGPMFSLATFLGYQLASDFALIGALTATIAVFLPGFLLLLVVLKHWASLAQHSKVAGALKGVNACVVGLLISALYQPVYVTAVHNPIDIALIIIGWYLFKTLKLPILALVGFYLVCGLTVL